MANPITPDDMRRIDEALSKLNEAKEVIKRSKMAGFDMSAQETTEKEQREKLLKIKAAFTGQ